MQVDWMQYTEDLELVTEMMEDFSEVFDHFYREE